MTEFFRRVNYWKMATLRVVVYMLVVGGTTFLSITETYSDATWKALGTFSILRILITVSLASFGALLAFLDQTMSRLQNGNGAKPVDTPPKP